MKLTRNLLAILALASFSSAFAGETGMGARHHEPAAAESHGMTATHSQAMKDCGTCDGCTKGTQKMTPPKVRETGPADRDNAMLELGYP